MGSLRQLGLSVTLGFYFDFRYGVRLNGILAEALELLLWTSTKLDEDLLYKQHMDERRRQCSPEEAPFWKSKYSAFSW